MRKHLTNLWPSRDRHIFKDFFVNNAPTCIKKMKKVKFTTVEVKTVINFKLEIPLKYKKRLVYTAGELTDCAKAYAANLGYDKPEDVTVISATDTNTISNSCSSSSRVARARSRSLDVKQSKASQQKQNMLASVPCAVRTTRTCSNYISQSPRNHQQKQPIGLYNFFDVRCGCKKCLSSQTTTKSES